jgi:LmbE family N-acetylglucosaminyl deacetylase
MPVDHHSAGIKAWWLGSEARLHLKQYKESLRIFRTWLLVRSARWLSRNYEVNSSSCVVIAPHPDDETFGTGGVIAQKSLLGAKVRVLFLTSGEASHSHCNCTDAETIKTTRESQAMSALRLLGVGADAVAWLRLPDGSVPMEGIAGFDEAVQKIAAQLHRWEPAEIYYPHALDANRDHQAAAQLVQAVLPLLPFRSVTMGYMVWGWYLPSASLLKGVLKRKWQRLDIRSVQSAKLAAVNCYLHSDPAPCGLPYCGGLPQGLVRCGTGPCEFFIREYIQPVGAKAA